MLLPYDPKAVVELAGELDRWKTQLDYRGPIPRAWAGRLRRDLEAEAVHASTSMEGVPVTIEEVHRILAGGAIGPTTTRRSGASARPSTPPPMSRRSSTPTWRPSSTRCGLST